MLKSTFGFVVAAIVFAGLAGGVAAQTEEGDEPTQAQLEQQLEQARQRLEESRRAMEEAAREVARATAAIGSGERFRDLNRQIRVFVRRARLGINIEDHDDGVRVLGVTPGGPASQAGIQSGDVIVSIDGEALAGEGRGRPSAALIDRLAGIEPGDTVNLVVQRDGAEQAFAVETDVMPAPFVTVRRSDLVPGAPQDFDFETFQFPGVFVPGPFGRWRDMELVELTPELGAYFGTETGILVVRAPRDEELQLVDGDVILDIGGREPTSPEHAHRILRSFEAGETLRITIMRNRRRQTLEFELPQPQRGPRPLTEG